MSDENCCNECVDMAPEEAMAQEFARKEREAQKATEELKHQIEACAIGRGKIDPWEHRSEGMRCRTCMWFVPKKGTYTKPIGRCRRHAPTMNGYPVVFVDDWCGDHKLNENAG